MQPLIDGDVLLYEAGFGAEREGEILPFDRAAEMLDNKIAFICAQVEASVPPKLFLTGKTNFRYTIAKSHPYKSGRTRKPWHYNNLKAYMRAVYDVYEQEGLEADDLLAIEQTKADKASTIICSRDKDLRQVEGWHYGWEVHNQPSFGPEYAELDGYIKLEQTPSGKRIKGVGRMFFLSQLLTGDDVDTVPGLGGRTGHVKAFKILENTSTYAEGIKAVYGAYKGLYGHSGYRRMLEQGQLLWMVRKLREDGSPILWGQNG